MKIVISPSLLLRFWKKVDKRKPDECWLWKGSVRKGYGNIFSGVKRGGNYQAHQVAFVIAHGPIPKGHEILHSCNNKPCMNPNHLSSGTHLENMTQASNDGLLGLSGERNGRSKLTLVQVLEIRNAPKPAIALVSRYGISYTHILRIRRSENWKHV